MTPPTVDFTLGQHNEAISRVSEAVERIEKKVDTITDCLSQQRGERKALTVLAHGMSALIGAVAAGATFLGFGRHP